MSVSGLLAQLLNGLASASSLFLVSVGLSLIFGVTRCINFAHGSFYMLGAFIAYSSVDVLAPHIGFWPALLIAPLACGVLGALTEILLLRRIYGAPELFQLLATFALVLVMAVRTCSSEMPLAASRSGSSSTRTAGNAPPLIEAWPTPSTWESFCAITVDAASYIWPRVSVSEVSARIMIGASAGLILR